MKVAIINTAINGRIYSNVDYASGAIDILTNRSAELKSINEKICKVIDIIKDEYSSDFISMDVHDTFICVSCPDSLVKKLVDEKLADLQDVCEPDFEMDEHGFVDPCEPIDVPLIDENTSYYGD